MKTVPPEIMSDDFGCFWNYQIRISFLSLRFFFERFDFLVCLQFNDMQRDCACACAVACLHPHNSISNVVVSLTMYDNIYIYIYILST